MIRRLALGTLAAWVGACSTPASRDGGLDAADFTAPLDALDAFDTSIDTVDTVDTAVAPTDATPEAFWLLDAAHGSGAACTVYGIPSQCEGIVDCPAEYAATASCSGAGVACCPVTPNAGWCPYNGMPQPNEGLVEEPGAGGCPDGMLRVDTFCVDRFEASLVVMNPDGTTQPWSPYWHPLAGLTYRAVSLRGAVPQGYISGVDAASACANAGKRLCTDTEWLRACQGPNGYTYPYGNTREPGVCNDARAMHPAIQCFGTSANWIWSDLGYGGINQQAMSLATTGSHDGCVTAEGAYDMMGNLHEWTSDPAGTFRGGYYVDTVLNGNGCLYVTTAHAMSHWDYSTGFRCCAD